MIPGSGGGNPSTAGKENHKPGVAAIFKGKNEMRNERRGKKNVRNSVGLLEFGQCGIK